MSTEDEDIIQDISYPNHRMLNLLPSGKCYRNLHCFNSGLRNSFFPSAINILNILTTLLIPHPPTPTLRFARRSTYPSAQFAHAHPYFCTWTNLK